MKITFEGEHVLDIANQMSVFLMNMGIGIAGQLDQTEPVDEDTEQVTEQVEGTGEPELDKDEETPQPSVKADPKKKPKKAEKEPDPVPEEEPDVDPEAAKKEAIDILMALYNDGKTDEVKALLGKFDVKKFSELPTDKGVDLLRAAEDLQKEPA